MKSKVLKVLIITLVFVMSIVFSNFYTIVKAETTMDDIMSSANSFLNSADENSVFGTTEIKDLSNSILNILLAIGLVLAVAVGTVLGIKFMISTVEERANIKKILVPYVVGCIILFGAFGIWKAVVTIMQSSESITVSSQSENGKDSSKAGSSSSQSSGSSSSGSSSSKNSGSGSSGSSSSKNSGSSSSGSGSSKNSGSGSSGSGSSKNSGSGSKSDSSKNDKNNKEVRALAINTNLNNSYIKYDQKTKRFDVQFRSNERDIYLNQLVTFKPSDATNKKLTATVKTNEKQPVVTIDKNGKLHIKGLGIATITIRSANGKIRKVNINVRQSDEAAKFADKATQYMETIANNNQYYYWNDGSRVDYMYGIGNTSFNCVGLVSRAWYECRVFNDIKFLGTAQFNNISKFLKNRFCRYYKQSKF